jgi:hypothetical protein
MKKPCPTCPFLACNKNKPTPTDFKCVEQNETDWYSQENIDGVWRVMQQSPIMFLSCHTTDPDYYGKEGAETFACVGAAFMVYMHFRIFQQVEDYDIYKRLVGKTAMTQRVMGEKALAMCIGKTSPLWGGMTLPKRLELDTDTLRLPTGFEHVSELFKETLQDEQK